jgi:hypothetical protein
MIVALLYCKKWENRKMKNVEALIIQNSNTLFLFFYIHSSYTVLLQFRGFSFFFGSYTIGRTPWTSDQSVARPLPKYGATQTQNKRTHTPNIHALSGIRAHDHSVRGSEDSSYLRWLGYRDRLASERAKTVHALDRAAAVTGWRPSERRQFML